MNAEQFEQARLQLGLTKTQLAEVLGLSDYRVAWRYETGRRKVPPYIKRHIEALLFWKKEGSYTEWINMMNKKEE